MKPLPVAAHNCYPIDASDGRQRLEHALKLGLDNIEIDLGWDSLAKQIIVSHDPEPRTGVKYFTLEEYLIPALEMHWKHPRPDGAPSVITLDWKTNNPQAIEALRGFLDSRSTWFSNCKKNDSTSFVQSQITVCLSGLAEAAKIYDQLIPADGTYRAFSDRDWGFGFQKTDPKSYSEIPASVFCRFLSIDWSQVEFPGPRFSGSWTQSENHRLQAIISHAHDQGYRVRFYNLNSASGGLKELKEHYRFPSREDAAVRWKAAATHSVDWIATDDYDDIVNVLQAS